MSKELKWVAKTVEIKEVNLKQNVWTSPKSGEAFNVIELTVPGKDGDQKISAFIKASGNPPFNQDDVGKTVELEIAKKEKDGYTNFEFRTEEMKSAKRSYGSSSSFTAEHAKMLEEIHAAVVSNKEEIAQTQPEQAEQNTAPTIDPEDIPF